MNVRISLIIASYNQPRSLALVLEALAYQTRPPDEIIIADDGSTAPTFEVIERCRNDFRLPIKAVITQEDKGFRKDMAQNKAVLRSTGQLLLFLDGDVIPPPHWIEGHAKAYRPMGYGIGTYLRLDLAESEAIARNGVRSIDWTGYLTKAKRDQEIRATSLKTRFYILLRVSDRPKVWGGNLSFGVNGFDERYSGFGCGDADLRNRMNNYGGRPRSLIYSTLALHLHPGLDNEKAKDVDFRNREPMGRSVYHISKKNLWAEVGLTARPSVLE
jgi:glycosyltransferase involved in cell wall biosynthesis